jgi:hypothetical protein
VTQDEQLTLDAGGLVGEALAPTFGVTGAMSSARQLEKGEEVRVVITNADGEVVATGSGYVFTVAFVEHRSDKAPTWTERQHKIKLTGE